MCSVSKTGTRQEWPEEGIYVEQLYTNCLAHAAYYIESQGVAAIVDPLRDPAPYLALCQSRNATLKYVLETHLHADFVGGQVDLHKKTGATVVFGPGAATQYTVHVAKDGEKLELGKAIIQVLHTPGHTMESSCFLLKDSNDIPKAVFTGDTLFVGSAGRPDLASKGNPELTAQDLATHLYHSLRSKLATLPDDVIVYPAHGPGSPCGANLGKETFSTIGKEKQTNYALNEKLSLEDFVTALTSGLTRPPAYFFHDVSLNKAGPIDYESAERKTKEGLSAARFKEEAQKPGVVILDSRPVVEFLASHVPGSINVGLTGQYAIWAGTLIDPKAPLLIVAKPEEASDSISRLARVGFDNVLGFLDGGIDAWKASGEAVETIQNLQPAELKSIENVKIIDVRGIPERENNGYLSNSVPIPLGELKDRLNELDSNQFIAVQCAGGYRSSMGASLLKKHGFNRVANVHGGWNLLAKEAESLGFPVTPAKAPGCGKS